MRSQDHTDRKVGGRYVLQETLGRGGMGVVWRGRDEMLDRTVAVKEISFPDRMGAPEREAARSRALREARAAARLNHASAVTIYDALEEDGRAYIVMEYVAAPSLADLIEAERTLPPERVAAIGLDVLAALEAAHATGIVHRDVKPANVMVPETGPAKLADFGIASVQGDPKLTHTGMVLGSPHFMSPEQARGTGSGPKIDLWGLGATLYTATEGFPPFDRGSTIATLTAVVNDELDPPAGAGTLAPAITALLTKDPDLRPDYERARSLLEEGLIRRTATPAPAPVTTQPEPLEPTREPAPAPPRRTSSLPAILLVLLLLLVAAAAFALTREEPPTRDAAPTEQGEEEAEGDGGDEADQEPSTDIPEDWETYQDEATGYEIQHPPGWEIVPRESYRIDFRNPDNGTYLRVEWTDSPGSSAKGAWEDSSQAMAASRADYEEISIEEVEYRDWDAALWEYSYSEGGADLHAYNLGFVPGDYGFALNLQTHEENWAEDSQLLELFMEAFEAP